MIFCGEQRLVWQWSCWPFCGSSGVTTTRNPVVPAYFQMASLDSWPLLPYLSFYFPLPSALLASDIFILCTMQWRTCLVAPLWMEYKKKIKMNESRTWYSNQLTKFWHFYNTKSFGLKQPLFNDEKSELMCTFNAMQYIYLVPQYIHKMTLFNIVILVLGEILNNQSMQE